MISNVVFWIAMLKYQRVHCLVPMDVWGSMAKSLKKWERLEGTDGSYSALLASWGYSLGPAAPLLVVPHHSSRMPNRGYAFLRPDLLNTLRINMKVSSKGMGATSKDSLSHFECPCQSCQPINRPVRLGHGLLFNAPDSARKIWYEQQRVDIIRNCKHYRL